MKKCCKFADAKTAHCRKLRKEARVETQLPTKEAIVIRKVEKTTSRKGGKSEKDNKIRTIC
eukprot:scaffold25882_cov55-Attheya_sp.AAC.2